MYSRIDVLKLRSEMKRLVPVITCSKKQVRDPVLNAANFAPYTNKNFKYGGSQKQYYFDGDPERTEKYKTYWKAKSEWQKSTGRFTKLCALLAHLRGKKHFSVNSDMGRWSNDRLVAWLEPEIEEFKMSI